MIVTSGGKPLGATGPGLQAFSGASFESTSYPCSPNEGGLLMLGRTRIPERPSARPWQRRARQSCPSAASPGHRQGDVDVANLLSGVVGDVLPERICFFALRPFVTSYVSVVGTVTNDPAVCATESVEKAAAMKAIIVTRTPVLAGSAVAFGRIAARSTLSPRQ